uniref:Uncharacterized protein n=1 Tax=Cannabis sativa TaxID=3483 RepID=A0A803R1B3_CANSA
MDNDKVTSPIMEGQGLCFIDDDDDDDHHYDHEHVHLIPMRKSKILSDAKEERSSGNHHKNVDEASNKRKSSHHRRIISKEVANNNNNNNNNNNMIDPQFTEEDYIIFCFREDGALEVVKNNGNKSTDQNHDQLPSSCLDRYTSSSRNSRPVNRKLNYGDNDHESLTRKLSHEFYPTNNQHMVEENLYLDSTCIYGGNFEEHNSSDHSAHSSNASSGSFAFPALGWESTGSPERMPNTEGLRLRKHRARFVVFQCCRF